MANPFNTKWTANLAYAVGLIATDGCLSKDGRHIDFTSKDLDQVQTLIIILSLKNKIGRKISTYNPSGIYYRVQFGNVIFYRFLLQIGLTPNKSKTLSRVLVPDKYFHDFLRGCLDGDGHTYSYWDPRWKSSFMLYTVFTSASLAHLEWLHEVISRLYNIKGKINSGVRSYQLVFAKNASILLINKLYYDKEAIYLKRKYFKIQQALSIIRRQAGML